MAAYTLETFADLKSHLADLLDDSETGSTAFYPEATRERMLNAAYFRLYNKMADLMNGQGPEIKTADLDLVSGQETIGTSEGLPTDIKKVTRIYYRVDDGNHIPWYSNPPANSAHIVNSYSQSSKVRFWSMRPTLSAGTRTDTMVVYPIPAASESAKVKLEYIPTCTELDEDTDVPMVPLEHRELIVYEALRRMLEKEKQNMSQLAYSTLQDLREQFWSDMANYWTNDNERVIAGDGEYWIYD